MGSTGSGSLLRSSAQPQGRSARLHRALESVVAALFLLGAVLLLRGRHGEQDEHVNIKAGAILAFTRAASTAFLVILATEFEQSSVPLAAVAAARVSLTSH